MNTPHGGVEVIKDLANRLHVPESSAIPANPYVLLGGIAGHRISYLGRGRQLHGRGDAFGIYARGAVYDDSAITHEVNIDFVGRADTRQIRQNIGHISLGVRPDGELSLATHGFDTQGPSQRIPIPTLAEPLGGWITAAAVKDNRANAAARAAGITRRAEPVIATAEHLEPLRTFVDDPASVDTYFRFAYQDGLAVGIVTAPV